MFLGESREVKNLESVVLIRCQSSHILSLWNSQFRLQDTRDRSTQEIVVVNVMENHPYSWDGLGTPLNREALEPMMRLINVPHGSDPNESPHELCRKWVRNKICSGESGGSVNCKAQWIGHVLWPLNYLYLLVSSVSLPDIPNTSPPKTQEHGRGYTESGTIQMY